MAPSPTPEPAARETIEFQSLSFPGTLWSPFLPPRTEGAPATISGILTLPPERDPLPAAIIMHGCSEVGPSELGWAERLNGLGVATFVVQSFVHQSMHLREAHWMSAVQGSCNLSSDAVTHLRKEL